MTLAPWSSWDTFSNLRQFQHARRDEVALMTYVGWVFDSVTGTFPDI